VSARPRHKLGARIVLARGSMRAQGGAAPIAAVAAPTAALNATHATASSSASEPTAEQAAREFGFER